MDALVSLVRRVGDVSELILVPEIDSYCLMDLLVNRQPVTLATLLRLRLHIENNQLSEIAPAEARARVARPQAITCRSG